MEQREILQWQTSGKGLVRSLFYRFYRQIPTATTLTENEHFSELNNNKYGIYLTVATQINLRDRCNREGERE